MEIISLNNFRRGPCKDHCYEVSSNPIIGIVEDYFVKLLTQDGQRTTAHRISPSGLWPVDLKMS